MRTDFSKFPEEYRKHTNSKVLLIVAGIGLLFFVFVLAISSGAVTIPLSEVVQTLLRMNVSRKWELIIWHIRLPQALTAIVAGIGLSISGMVMQSVLRNPLGSPFTLGISHAAAFGAAFSVIVLKSGTMQSSGMIKVVHPYLTTGIAFLFSLIATAVIMVISQVKKTQPQVIVLTGVALGSLFTAGTMFLQYFADDVQLAAMVFWTFGDVARASWKELGVITVIVCAALSFFFLNRWNYNAMDAGDETAKGIGVRVEHVRIWAMVVSSVLTATIISFLGVIGFIGLVCPHMARKAVGDDHRYLLPCASIVGASLLLAADTLGRCIMAPHTLPVAILTSFLGVPVFMYLIVKGSRR